MQTVYRLNNTLDQKYGHLGFSQLSISHTRGHTRAHWGSPTKAELGSCECEGSSRITVDFKWRQSTPSFSFVYIQLDSRSSHCSMLSVLQLDVCWAEGDVNDTVSHQHQMTEAPRNAQQETFGGGPQNPKTGSSQTPKNRPLKKNKKS